MEYVKSINKSAPSSGHTTEQKPVYDFFKRIFDIICSSAALIILSPVFLILTVAIKTTDKGPVFFTHRRVGKDGKPLNIYKFRSMVTNAEDLIKQFTPEQKAEYERNFKLEDDPRVTKVGKFIRSTSIDELPQLFNVLIGNMSLVGPRPETQFFVSKFQKSIPQYMLKHYVKPGMTGWAQVNDLRGGDTSIEERIKYDMYYIENWTFMFDIKILFMTLTKGIFSKNGF